MQKNLGCKSKARNAIRNEVKSTLMREVLEKRMISTECDGLNESVTKESANDKLIARKQPVKPAKRGLKRLKSKFGIKAVISKVLKSKVNAAVTSLTKVSRPAENQRDRVILNGGEKDLMPPMLLAGLMSTSSQSKKSERTLAGTLPEMVINQCG